MTSLIVFAKAGSVSADSAPAFGAAFKRDSWENSVSAEYSQYARVAV